MTFTEIVLERVGDSGRSCEVPLEAGGVSAGENEAIQQQAEIAQASGCSRSDRQGGLS